MGGCCLPYDCPDCTVQGRLPLVPRQAVDVVHQWTLGPDGEPLVPFTTFSICMIHRQSGGRLPLFADGLKALKALKPGDRVLVAEACNHNRITDVCNDIGMVQVRAQLAAFAQWGERRGGPRDRVVGDCEAAVHQGGHPGGGRTRVTPGSPRALTPPRFPCRSPSISPGRSARVSSWSTRSAGSTPSWRTGRWAGTSSLSTAGGA